MPNSDNKMAWQIQSAPLVAAQPPKTFFGLPPAADASAAPFEAVPNVHQLVSGCAYFSPFLRDLLARHARFIAAHMEQPFSAVVGQILEGAQKRFTSQTELRTALRHTRQKLMLYLALADCGAVAEPMDVMQALSIFADIAIEASMAFELSLLAQKNQLTGQATHPEHCGISVLAQGKLGAHELNYSSDIDVVAYLEPERFAYDGPKDRKTAAVQMMRRVFGHLSAQTSEGFVFRVDLRLRPNPGSTPIVMSLDAAELYYQSQGLTWERAALIKARHCAGDPTVSADFLARVRPFVWRRHLDFTAIDDVLAMKQRVHDHHHHEEGDQPCPGFDLKLGHGGIREIEFFAQIQQLIKGGKRPELQIRPTCDVLQVLEAEGDIEAAEAKALIDAYMALRIAEHRLQMMNDAQTHCLPDQEDKADALAQFLGFETSTELYSHLRGHCARVSALFDTLLAGSNGGASSASQVSVPLEAKDIVSRWQTDGYRALSATRSKHLLDRLLPDLLEAFQQTPDPHETLLYFDSFIKQLPAGVQLFSLLDANRPLLQLLANIMGQSPELSGQLARRPALFEGLINEALSLPMMTAAELEADLDAALANGRDYETILELLRIWNGEARFQTGVRLLEGLSTPADCRQAYSKIAEITLKRLLVATESEFAKHHGHIGGAQFGIVALGSFGAEELVTSSDLDLTFLYDVPNPTEKSSGERPLAVNTYFARLSQRIITGLTSLTSEGRLYEVDMRLRPSGRSGIIAVSIDAFEQYHGHGAWLWEHMSLTKARYVAGPEALGAHFQSVKDKTLGRAVDAGQVHEALWTMRRKLKEAMGARVHAWSFKSGDGGLTDSDFLVEGLTLKHAAPEAKFHRWEDWWRLVGPKTENIPIARKRLLDGRTVRSLLIPKGTRPQDAPRPARAKLAALLGYKDFSEATEAIRAARMVIFTALQDLLPPPEDTP